MCKFHITVGYQTFQCFGVWYYSKLYFYFNGESKIAQKLLIKNKMGIGLVGDVKNLN